ncbi:hypothetical protein BJ322DRAFT_191611 [Thelephora terrestris]|uniref:Uncharacterized protein n=1 Tax=Thelephora terrestris TaxID=56493 RepID=A0A9P6HAW4_9AGAM|nr:hypothetical protein BJ322DRAFT_191611 [Thelephora terrestris]
MQPHSYLFRLRSSSHVSPPGSPSTHLRAGKQATVLDDDELAVKSRTTPVYCPREPFLTDNIYTALVAINPHTYVPSNADSVRFKYAEYRNTSEDKTLLPPHIFQLAKFISGAPPKTNAFF